MTRSVARRFELIMILMLLLMISIVWVWYRLQLKNIEYKIEENTVPDRHMIRILLPL